MHCKENSLKNLIIEETCSQYCPNNYFKISENNSCKKCSTPLCINEIMETEFVISKESEVQYKAKINKMIYFKKIDKNRRILQNENYCHSEIPDMKLDEDYKIDTVTEYEDGYLTCVANLTLFKSFYDKKIDFEINPDFLNGDTVIIDEQGENVYISKTQFNIIQYQRYLMLLYYL